MTLIRSLLLSAVAGTCAGLSGAALAHQGHHLPDHAHPHLGVEHLLLVVAALAALGWLVRRIRGR